jgi:hypothetical protein
VRPRSTRRLVWALATLLVMVGAGTSQARRYVGVHVKGHVFRTGGRGPTDVQIRFVCPPATQASPRPGDFSFCTGNVVITSRGTVVAQGPFSIRTFDSHLEHFPTTAAGRRLLRPGRRVTVHWRARNHDGQGHYRTNSGNVVVVG